MEILISNLLRPYRSTYSFVDLGKKRSDNYIRNDGTIVNERGLLIHYSYYQHSKKTDVCLVYCHCNSGSRIQGVQYLSQFIEKGWNVCLFDFSGSGQSEGNFISLGYYEARDLQFVLKKLRSLDNKRFLLWGRSMGAATIIFYLNESKFREDIIACILDSPYASLWSLIKQIIKQRSILPGFIIETVLDFLRDRVKEDYLFDLKQLEPLKYISQIDQPLFFITSLMDECVKSQDVIQLYKNAGSRIKQLQYIDKPHNSSRDKSTVDLAVNFLQKNLNQRLKRKKQLKIFVKNNKDLTGANMADLILKVQKEKDQMRRMKSEHNFDRSFKENKNQSNHNNHLKTQFFTSISANLTKQIQRNPSAKRQKRKKIKFSLAHIEHKKIVQIKKNLKL